jgi:mono/diheme cytochrome c family protein
MIMRTALALIAGGLFVLVGMSVAAAEEPAEAVSVTVPELAWQEQLGQQAFGRRCAECHGENGSGSDKGPPLIHRIYEPGHHGDISFFRAARFGVRAHHWPFGKMPPVPDITDEELQTIVQFVRAVQRANGIE